MANKTISDLAAASSVFSTDLVELAQPTSKKATIAQIAAVVNATARPRTIWAQAHLMDFGSQTPGGDGLASILNFTDAYGGSLILPSNFFQLGYILHFKTQAFSQSDNVDFLLKMTATGALSTIDFAYSNFVNGGSYRAEAWISATAPSSTATVEILTIVQGENALDPTFEGGPVASHPEAYSITLDTTMPIALDFRAVPTGMTFYGTSLVLI